MLRTIAVSIATIVFCICSSLAAGQEPKAEDHAKAAAQPATSEKEAAAPDAAHGGGHGGHDETDLSHGNSTAALKSPTDVRFDMAIYTFVLFLILLAVLYKFAWGPIATALERREETIHRQIEEARLASERAAQQLKEYEVRLSAATDEARQIVAQARKDAEIAKDKIVAEARDAASRERERAVADINVAKNQALDAIAQKSVQTAVSLARNILRREVKPQEHEALIGDAINKLSKMN